LAGIHFPGENFKFATKRAWGGEKLFCVGGKFGTKKTSVRGGPGFFSFQFGGKKKLLSGEQTLHFIKRVVFPGKFLSGENFFVRERGGGPGENFYFFNRFAFRFLIPIKTVQIILGRPEILRGPHGVGHGKSSFEGRMCLAQGRGGGQKGIFKGHTQKRGVLFFLSFQGDQTRTVNGWWTRQKPRPASKGKKLTDGGGGRFFGGNSQIQNGGGGGGDRGGALVGNVRGGELKGRKSLF